MHSGLAVLTAFLLLLVTTGTVQGQETITAPVVPTATSTEGPESSNDQQGGSQTRLKELTVTERRPTTAASSETIRARDYDLRPHTTTQEILNNVPGLVVAQHQGGGKATQYFLRGFDADHGTDVAVFVDGVPVNMVSHAHGQGYADLNFLIPEIVQRIELYKGPYFVEYGDLEFHRGGDPQR